MSWRTIGPSRLGPLGVNRVVLIARASLPVYPDETFSVSVGMKGANNGST